MKITVWMSEETLNEFHSNQPITGDFYHREPGVHLDTIQVQLTYDEYYQLKDNYIMSDAEIMREMHEQQLEQPWDCSLPEGAEWDVKYDVSTSKDKEIIELIKALVNEDNE
jgi:hypothetical protein